MKNVITSVGIGIFNSNQNSNLNNSTIQRINRDTKTAFPNSKPLRSFKFDKSGDFLEEPAFNYSIRGADSAPNNNNSHKTYEIIVGSILGGFAGFCCLLYCTFSLEEHFANLRFNRVTNTNNPADIENTGTNISPHESIMLENLDRESSNPIQL